MDDVRWGETAEIVDMYRSMLLQPKRPQGKPKVSSKSKKKSSKEAGSAGKPPLPVAIPSEPALHKVDAVVPTSVLTSMLKTNMFLSKLAEERQRDDTDWVPTKVDAVEAIEPSPSAADAPTIQGILGLLELIPVSMSTQPKIAVRLLAGMLTQIEAMPPASLQDEPSRFFDEVTARLVRLANKIPSIAGPCCGIILALALARGNFQMILGTSFTLMTNTFKNEFMQLPSSFIQLYRASLQAYFPVFEPRSLGFAPVVPTDATILDHFTLVSVLGSTDPHPGTTRQCSIACDGVYTYIQNREMLFKTHTGLGHGLQGQVVAVAPVPRPYDDDTRVQLVCLAGALLRFVQTETSGGLEIINPYTLEVEATDEQVQCPSELFTNRCYLLPVNSASATFGALFVDGRNRVWEYQRYQCAFEEGTVRQHGSRLTLNNAEIDCHVHGNAPWLPAAHREALIQEAILLRAISFVAAANFVLLLTCTGEVYTIMTESAGRKKTASVKPTWSKIAVPEATRVTGIVATQSSQAAYLLTEGTESYVVRSAAPKVPTPEECLVSDKTLKHKAHTHPVGRSAASASAFGGGWYCNVCGAYPSSGRLRCTEGCDWDVCLPCMQKEMKNMDKPDPTKLVVSPFDGLSGTKRLKTLSVGKAISLALDGSGGAWTSGECAERMLPFKIPKGAVVTYDAFTATGIKYAEDSHVSKLNASTQCTVLGFKLRGDESLLKSTAIEVQISAKCGSTGLPSALSSTLFIESKEYHPTEFISEVDERGRKVGVLVFQAPELQGLEHPAHFVYGDTGFDRVALFVPVHTKVVTASIDVAHSTSRNMRIDHEKLEVNMANSGPKILVSAESTTDGVLRWKVANLGNAAIEFGAVSQNFKGNDSGLHKTGTVGISSSSTSGSCLKGVPMRLGEFVEVIVDAANGTFECKFEDSSKNVTQPLQFPDWKSGDEVWLAITLWSGGKIKFDELGFSSKVAEFTATRQMHPLHIETDQISSVSAGDHHACLLLESGNILALGRNDFGQCGIPLEKDAVAVFPAEAAGVAADGVAAKDADEKKEDGDFDEGGGNVANAAPAAEAVAEDQEEWVTQPRPAHVASHAPPRFVKVACGGHHTLALDEVGMVWSCGRNDKGQLGRRTEGSYDYHLAPVEVLPKDAVMTSITAGDVHSIVVDSGGNVIGFGSNDSNQLGCVGPVEEVVSVVTSKRSGLQPIVCTWGHTSVVLSTETAIDTDTNDVIAVYCAQRETDSTVCLTVIGSTSDEDDGKLSAGTFPLVDNAYCAVEELVGSAGVVACFEPSFKNLWSFRPNDGRVCRHHVVDSGPCPSNVAAAAIPYGLDVPAKVSTVGLSLLSMSAMAVYEGGQKFTRASTAPPAEAIRFPSGGTQSWNVSGSADAICIKSDTPVTLLGVKLFGNGSTLYQASVEVAEEAVADPGFFGSAAKDVLTSGRVDSAVCDEGGIAYSVLFDEPIELDDSKRYHLIANISGVGGASSQSKAGNNGLKTIHGDDGVVFTVTSSRFSNNGTGDTSGQVYGVLYRASTATAVTDDVIAPCAESFGLEDSPSSNSVSLLTSTIVRSLQWLQHEVIRDASWCPHAVISALTLCSWAIRKWFYADMDKQATRRPKTVLDADAIDAIVAFKAAVISIIEEVNLSVLDDTITEKLLASALCAFSDCFQIFFPNDDDQLAAFMFNGGVGDRGIVLQLATFESIKKAHKKVLQMIRSSVDSDDDDKATVKVRSEFSSPEEYGNYIRSVLKSRTSGAPCKVGIVPEWPARGGTNPNDEPERYAYFTKCGGMTALVSESEVPNAATSPEALPYSRLILIDNATTPQSTASGKASKKPANSSTSDAEKHFCEAFSKRSPSALLQDRGTLFEELVKRLLTTEALPSDGMPQASDQDQGDLSSFGVKLRQSASDLLVLLMQRVFEEDYCVQEFVTMCLNRVKDYLDHMIHHLMPDRELLSRAVQQSALLSRFVPDFTVHLGVYMDIKAGLAEDVLDLVSAVIERIEELTPPPTDGDASSMPWDSAGENKAVLVESDHPYSRPSRKCQTVKFGESVKLILLHFDHRCSTLQPEDRLTLSMMNDAGEKSLICSFSANTWPSETVVIPGNELVLEFSTASNYAGGEIADEATRCFGFRCIVQGRTISVNSDHLHILENEMVMIAAAASVQLASQSKSTAHAAKDGLAELAPARFHKKCKGRNISISSDGTVATRTDSYNHGVVISESPLRVVNREKFFQMKMTRHGENDWAGSLAVGIVCVKDPDNSVTQGTWRNYSTASTVSERKWIVNGASVNVDSGRQENKNFRIKGKSLGELGKNSIIRVSVDQSGTMYMGFGEGTDREVVCTGVPFDTELHAFADIYGKAVAVELYDAEAAAMKSSPKKNTFDSAVKKGQAEFASSPLSLLESRPVSGVSPSADTDVPKVVIEAAEEKFLKDLVECNPDTPGGLLASWMFGTKFIDPRKCTVKYDNSKVQTTIPRTFTLETRDSAGERIYDDAAHIEIYGTLRDRKVSGAKLTQIAGLMEPHKNGTYSLSWKSGYAGTHDIVIKVDGHHVAGSPFEVEVFAETVQESATKPGPPFSSGGSGRATRSRRGQLSAAASVKDTAGSSPGTGLESPDVSSAKAFPKGFGGGKWEPAFKPPSPGKPVFPKFTLGKPFTGEGGASDAAPAVGASPPAFGGAPAFGLGAFGGGAPVFGSKESGSPEFGSVSSFAKGSGSFGSKWSSGSKAPSFGVPEFGAKSAFPPADSKFGSSSKFGSPSSKFSWGKDSSAAGPSDAGSAPLKSFGSSPFSPKPKGGVSEGSPSTSEPLKPATVTFAKGSAESTGESKDASETTEKATPSNEGTPDAAKPAAVQQSEEKSGEAESTADTSSPEPEPGNVPTAELASADALALRTTMATILRMENVVRDAMMCGTHLKFRAPSPDDSLARVVGGGEVLHDESDDEVSRTKSAHVPTCAPSKQEKPASIEQWKLEEASEVGRTVSGGSPHRAGRIRPAQDRDIEITKDLMLLRSKVVVSDLRRSRDKPVCPAGHTMPLSKSGTDEYEKKGWGCDVPACKNKGQIKKMSSKSKSSKSAGGSDRYYCKECSNDICIECVDKRAPAFSYCHIVIATGKTDEDGKIVVYGSPNSDTRVGAMKVVKGSEVRVTGEDADAAGNVWLEFSDPKSPMLSVNEGHSGSVWVPYCTTEFSPYFRKQKNSDFRDMFDKADYLLRLRRPAETHNDIDLCGDPFSNSLYSRIMTAQDESATDVSESEALARRLSVREGSVSSAAARAEPRGVRSLGSLSMSKWAKVRSEIQTSSVALRDVARGDSVGQEIIAFMHSHLTVSDAARISRQRIASLERRLKAINSFSHLLVSASSLQSVHTVLWALSRISTAPVEIPKDAASSSSIITLKTMGYSPLSEFSDDSPATTRLRHAFHRLLSIVLDYMKALPPHHPVQHAALRCWAVSFEEADHAFFHQKHVFSEISQLLSHSEAKVAKVAESKVSPEGTIVTNEENITDRVVVKVSSREAMIASLTDGSTETFWESGDDESNRPKFISFELPKEALAGSKIAFSLHIDNSRDSGNQVQKIVLKSGLSRKDAAILSELPVPKTGAWYTLVASRADLGAVVGVEILGSGANVRVRQVAVFQLGLEAQQIVAEDVHTDICRGDALFVFQHLSKQILEAALDDETGKGEIDGAARTASGSHDLKQHVVSLLGAGDRFSAMQRNLTRHLIKELHTEAVSYKGEDAMTGGGDEYSFQLLSMIQGLIGSAAGGKFIGQSPGVIFDLALHLVKGTPRVQRQVLSVLTKLIPLVDGGSSTMEDGQAVGIVPTLLLTLASSINLQVRCKGQAAGASNLTARDACRSAASEITSLFNGNISPEVAAGIVSLFKEVLSPKGATLPHAMRIRSGVMEHVDFFKRKELALVGPEELVEKPDFWCAMASLCVLNEELANEINQNEGPRDMAVVCANHDDGVTPGEWRCADCDMLLCTECDQVLHLGKSMCNHKREQLELAEPDLQVDFFEDTGRVRLKNIVTNVNGRTLKGLVEFKRTQTAAVACRFCGDDLTEDGPLTNLSKCGLPNVCKICVDEAKATCTKVLSCGHPCQGLRNEAQCLVCLVPNCPSRVGLNIHQDAEDECFCYCGNLAEQACIQLHCGHIMHHTCIDRVLRMQWSGPRINFDFARCPVCRVDLLDNEQHPALQELLVPVRALHKSVKEKSLMRLEYDGAADMTISEADRAKLAMKKYAYYICHRCEKPYFGGEYACAAAAGDEYDPTELVCGACVGGAAAQVCPKHGTDYLEYKCRFCCSVATFFCFGTTHFCTPCHDEHSKCTNTNKADMPQCPCAPVMKPLEGSECPLHIWHPPTGEEFALGCGVCRNAQTF
eukprot:m.148788 g.148788  ORF g.148788 m.148788 type:complete len:4349 (-) comp14220_c3_seq1:875-13921(-)